MRTVAAFNLVCDDLDRQFAFYGAVLGWDEDLPSRSPIFRAYRHESLQLGLNARAAYALLGLAERAAPVGVTAPVRAYATFIVGDPAAVDRAVEAASRRGGSVLKPPFATYYHQWQAVLADPEGNVFRIASTTLPVGAGAAPQPF